MPNKGDIVRVTIEGEYSHQRSDAGSWHIVKVPNPRDKLRRKVDVAVPPDTQIEVLKKRQPVEPLAGVVVHNRATGNWWRNTGAINRNRWECLSLRSFTFALSPTSWQDLLTSSGNGHRLEVYVAWELQE